MREAMTRGAVRYEVLATDYDGTLTGDGESVAEDVTQGLQRLKAAGRKLVLITGRVLDDLIRVFPAVDVFDRVVAENGAVLYCPATRDLKVLAERPSRPFIERLEALGVTPLSVGHVIVATLTAHEATVSQAIRELRLNAAIAYNKGSIMVLPPGVTKASGLRAALDDLRVGPCGVLGIGDAENDDSLLGACSFGVAVGNALPALKGRAHMVTAAAGGAGVLEAIALMLDG